MDEQKKKREKFLYLPEAHDDHFIIDGADQPEGLPSRPGPGPEPAPTPGAHPCPCCGYLTFPVPKEEAIAYICPVCFWENDVFDPGEDDPSDENGGMTLRESRENFKQYGAVRPDLVQHARPPLPEEVPPGQSDPHKISSENRG